jgi:hypothetical protein
MAFPVWIGWDSREPEAAEVTKSSLLQHATIPVHVQYLKESALRHSGLYRRRWVEENGQKYDSLDGKPFSTEFSFTRFLVPALQQWEGWALFVDCDWLFRADIKQLVDALDDRYAAMCCQQNYQPEAVTKMDGVLQQKYRRKNWSSFLAFNCSHPSNKFLTVDAVNGQPGGCLHGLEWLSDTEIGALDPTWNWINGTTEGEPKGVHYTLGGPWFPHMRESQEPYFEEWRQEARRIGAWT